MKNKAKKENKWADEDLSFESPAMEPGVAVANLAAFGAFRQAAKGKISEKDKLRLSFLRLKYDINEFLHAQKSDYRFQFFLRLYMNCFNLNGKTFASEIHIKPAELSQILHGGRDPNERIMMRLEIHSNYNFPAPLWYAVLAKQKALELKNDDQLRKSQQAVVRPKVGVVI